MDRSPESRGWYPGGWSNFYQDDRVDLGFEDEKDRDGTSLLLSRRSRIIDSEHGGWVFRSEQLARESNY